MNSLKKLIITFLFAAAALAPLQAQNLPIIVEAESGTLGASFTTGTSQGANYITINSTLGGSNPSIADRVATYTVTFPSAGTYDLYARILVGPATFNDDSMYYASSFGAKDPANSANWILANNLDPVGYNTPTDLVLGAGTVANGPWKWIKLSAFNGGASPVSFIVPSSGLTQTFQIAGREDGLLIDKIAFGLSGVFFTVSNLDNGTAGSTVPPPPPFTPTGPPIAQGKPKFLGSISSPTQIVNFTHYWNQVTPENGGKWGSVEATRGTFNWTDEDTAYQLAKNNNYPYKHHNLIWGSQQPAWIESLSPADQLTEIQNWFNAVATRYPAIDFIDVVNEPLHTPPSGPGTGNYIDALGGAGSTGWDWVLTAYRMARATFPNAKLLINEYSVTNDGNAAQRYIHLIQLLQAENLIDGIGIQGHAFETTVPASVTKTNLDTIANATGLPIYISEMDIDGPTDDIQLADYKRIFPVFWQHPAVKGVTLWGYLPGMWRTAQGAYLALSNGAERPALQWLRAYVQDNVPTINAGQNFWIQAGSSDNSAVGTVLATDADVPTTFQNWTITGGTGQAVFAINASTGQLTVKDHTQLSPSVSSYTLTITVSDGLATSDAQTVTVNVTPSPFRVTLGGYALNRRTNTITQTVTLTNVSGTTASGPVYLILDNLSSNTSLSNANGTSINHSGPASVYIVASISNVASGASVTVALQFTVPASGGITYTPRTLTGPASP